MGKDDIGHVYPFPRGDVPLWVENIYLLDIYPLASQGEKEERGCNAMKGE